MALSLEDKLAKGSSDLRFLLTNHGVKDDHQGKLYDCGIDTLAKFAAFVTTARELADLLKGEFSIDPAESLEKRAQVASYTVAWQAAQTRIKAQADAEATNEIRDLAKPIPVSDYMAMRQAFSKAFGELEDKYIPSKEYIEKKLNELESGEFRAEQLSEVVGRDEVDPDTLLPAWDSKGHITVKKASSTVAMPTGPEQLRHRITVMFNALAMIKLRHVNRTELSDVTSDIFDKYKDYLLGDYVYGLRSADGVGSAIPPWTLVLGYDHAIRKLAYKLVSQEGYKLGEALKKAWKDPTVKERHFITPLALYSKRPLEPWNPKGGKGKDSKGKGKGKNAIKGKGSSRTPENKPICFRYNSKGGCKKGDKCHFTHVCTLCFAKHPSYQCKTSKNDAQGAAAT